MTRHDVEPVERRCSCGADFRFDTRQRIQGTTRLATCSNPDCGVVVTGGSPEDGLRACLLGDVAVVRALSPWVRLFFKSITWGYKWRSHYTGCPYCESELTVELHLPPRHGRHRDVSEVVLCLTCGATTTRLWLNGESILHSLEGSAWQEPAVALQALRRALAERAGEAPDPYTWDFG
jgi:hypothetical protein